MARALTSYPRFEDAARAADAMGALRDEVRAHLAHEEAAAVPYIVEHLGEQWPAFEARQRKDAGVSGLTRFLPWVLDDADPVRADWLRDRVPAPVFAVVSGVFLRRRRRGLAALNEVWYPCGRDGRPRRARRASRRGRAQRPAVRDAHPGRVRPGALRHRRAAVAHAHRPGRLAEGGVGGQFWSVYVPGERAGERAVAATLEQIDFVHRLVAAYPQRLSLALTRGTIVRVLRDAEVSATPGSAPGR